MSNRMYYQGKQDDRSSAVPSHARGKRGRKKGAQGRAAELQGAVGDKFKTGRGNPLGVGRGLELGGC